MTDFAIPISLPPLHMAPPNEGAVRPTSGGAYGGPEPRLAGKSVLIVEDETFVAVELKFAIEDAGGTALGPFFRLNQAMDFLSRRDAAIDAAVLDINLGGVSVFPLARRLADRGVPLLFNTANADLPKLKRDFADSPVCAKPASPETILTALKRLLA